MREFRGGLGTAKSSLATLRRFSSEGVDTRPMRWRNYDDVDVVCRYPDAEGLDCYQVRTHHDTTGSGDFRVATFEVCWREGKIRRIDLLATGDGGGI